MNSRLILVACCAACALALPACGSDDDPGGGSGGTGATGGAAGAGGTSGAGGTAGSVASCEGAGAAAGMPDPISWGACTDPDLAGSTLQCASFEVPVDYADPSGAKYTLDVMRLPASDPALRDGVVLLHAGGPGQSSIALLKGQYTLLPAIAPEAIKRKDIVVMDGRGISKATQIKYMTDALTEAYRTTDTTPDDDADWQALDAAYKAMTDAAVAKYPAAQLATYGTRDEVRDIVRLIAALGEDKIGYLGVSYGTIVGAAFATACPSKVGAFVLDSALTPIADFPSFMRRATPAREQLFVEYANACSLDTSCPFHTGESSAQIQAAFRALSASLEAQGGVVIGSRTLVEQDLYAATMVFIHAYDATGLWDALAKAEQGDWTAMLDAADKFWERQPDGTYPDDGNAHLPIMFNDTPCPAGWSLADTKQAVANAVKEFPNFGAFLVVDSGFCIHWPVHAAAPIEVKKTSAPPMLIIGGNRDIVTPAQGAKDLVALLDNGSYLLTHDQEAHGGFRSNKCVKDVVIAFLLDPKAPAVTHCDAL